MRLPSHGLPAGQRRWNPCLPSRPTHSRAGAGRLPEASAPRQGAPGRLRHPWPGPFRAEGRDANPPALRRGFLLPPGAGGKFAVPQVRGLVSASCGRQDGRHQHKTSPREWPRIPFGFPRCHGPARMRAAGGMLTPTGVATGSSGEGAARSRQSAAVDPNADLHPRPGIRRSPAADDAARAGVPGARGVVGQDANRRCGSAAG